MTGTNQHSEAVETHISQVFLAADRVYKILKPVTMPFVDFSDRAMRMAAITTEFELNHRICPDVYLGVFDVTEDDPSGAPVAVDRMMVMKRLPADRQLDHLVDDEEFFTYLREVARFVATFHAGQPPVSGTAAEPATVGHLTANWADNIAAVGPLVGPFIPQDEYDRVRTLVAAYLAGREQLFAERIEAGWVRDGHGDLRCEHVFCLDDGPRLIDCLAFRDDFRIADVLNDVAFLAMDLHRLAGPAAAKYLIDMYAEFAGEHHPSSLAHHYVAYRASVRAKVAAIRFGQGDTAAGEEARMYHRLAAEHLELGQTRLILVGGGAGVGKSTVAAGLGERLAATWLRADEVRKQLAGMQSDQHAFAEPDEGIYTPDFSDSVYAEMLRRAELLLTRGESVILDASWSVAEHRAVARAMADRTYTELVELHCDAPLSVAKERIARRSASMYNPSDATPAIAQHMASRFDPWREATLIDTNQSVACAVDAAYGRIMVGTAGSPASHASQASQALQVCVDEAGLTEESIGFFLAGFTRLAVLQPRQQTRQ